jgi:TusA-related sulfurtransferase
MDLEKIKSDVLLDARGKYCPEPLTLTAKKMREEVQKDQILEVWSEDEAAVGDLNRWCKRTRHEMLGNITDK